jgi:ribosomal protein L37E
MKIRCACCGHRTVSEEYDICPVCGWEKDKVQERFIGYRGGANKLCLAEARELFRLDGCSDPAFADSVRPPVQEEI